MALGFFRRHQKGVMIIMVFLMVSFLVSTLGWEYIGRRIADLFHLNPEFREVGTSVYGPVQAGRLQSLKAELYILRQTALSEGLRRTSRYRVPGADEFALLEQNGDNDALAFALLLQEAEHNGVKVAGQEVQNEMEMIGLTGEYYKNLLSRLQGDREAGRVTDAEVRQAVRDWLMVYKSAQENAYDVPPSETEVAHLYQDISERINLRVVKVSAEELVAKALATTMPTTAPSSSPASAPSEAALKRIAAVPSEAEINAQFMSFRGVAPGTLPDKSAFGFGYKLPDRAKVAYLFISQRVLDRAVRPSPDELMQYYRDHRKDKVRVPEGASAQTRPESAPSTASAPASRSAEEAPKEKEVVLGSLPFSQAKPIIVKLLAPEAADKRKNDLVNRAAEIELRLAGRQLPTGMNIYEAIVRGLPAAGPEPEVPGLMQTGPAEMKLAATIRSPIRNVPLDRAMDMLAEDVGLTAICYPWGRHGSETYSQSLLVSVNVPEGQQITLEAALKQIAMQLKMTAMIGGWRMCDQVDNVLFPIPASDVDDLEMFPVSARQTPLEDLDAFRKDDVLGSSYVIGGGGRTLIQEAFTAQPFGGDPRMPHMKVGDKGSQMQVMGATPGWLLWRLLDAAPAADPEPSAINTDAELRKKVIHDIRITVAMAVAQQEALAIERAAVKDGLEKAAAAAGFESYETGMFSRKNFNLQWNDVPKLDLDAIENAKMRESLKESVIGQVFSLVPKNVEPTTQGYGTSGILSLRLPPKREVVLVQRIGYSPSVKSEFESFGRRVIAGYLANNRLASGLQRWFFLGMTEQGMFPFGIAKRVDYKKKLEEGGPRAP